MELSDAIAAVRVFTLQHGKLKEIYRIFIKIRRCPEIKVSDNGVIV
jgi:hypothetical protein